MTGSKDAKFDEITQSSMLISLFSGVDPKTKHFENVPVIMGGEGLVTDRQAQLKVEEAFGQLNLPDLFRTFDFTLYRSSYEPYKLKEDLVISPYIYTVKAKHQDTFVMGLFLTPWADVNLSQFQEKIIDFARDFSGIFRRTTEEIHTSGKDFSNRTKECAQGGNRFMEYLSHLVFDQRQMLGGTEKVSKPTKLLAVLFQRGKISKYFICSECGNSYTTQKASKLENCPNCKGQIAATPVHLFDPLNASFAYPQGLSKAESTSKKLHKPIDLLYLFQTSYLPNEIRVTLNRISEHIFTFIVPLPHQALFEYRDTDDILVMYSLSKLEGDDIMVISGISDSVTQVEGQLSQMALRLFIRDLNEGVKKGYSREDIFSKSILKEWQLSSWIPLKGEFTPEPLTSWTKLKKLASYEES
jgi:rubrerythrin